MLSERQLEAVLKVFEERTQALTDSYLRKIGEHLREIGKATPSDVNRLIELKRMGVNVDRMKAEIAKSMNAAAKDVEDVFFHIAETDYRFAEMFYREGQIPIRKNKALLRVLQAQLRQTTDQLTNLSRTTVVRGAYKSAIDVAVQAAQSGMTDYNTAIRGAVRDAACEGLRVKYESGNTRRLDSAVRMNVLDGARQLNQDVTRQTGKEYGADGVEISAHALCAADHLPYQGKQYSNREFEDLQATLERPIGQWNCRHFAFPILLGADPTYSDEQLDRFRRNSEERITIGDTTKTRYEWSQEQRAIETAVRRQKDIANLAKASGDDALRRTAQANINALDDAYSQVTNAAGLYAQRERMAVAGFRPVKASVPDKRFAIKPKSVTPLQGTPEGGIIPADDTSARFDRNGGALTKPYRNNLAERFSKGSPTAQSVYDKYIPDGGAVSNGASTGTAYYSPSTNTISMDFAADVKNQRGAGATWFHEHGHYVDANAGNISVNTAFAQAISADCKAYEKAFKHANKLSSVADVRNGIAKELRDIGDSTHSIQDILGGVVGKPYPGAKWAHTESYWKQQGPTGVCKEAFAHMFEASFDPRKSAMMERCFPSAWAEFQKMIGGIA